MFENFKTKGSRTKDTILSMVVEVHDIQNERLVKRMDKQEFGFRPSRVITEILLGHKKSPPRLEPLTC